MMHLSVLLIGILALDLGAQQLAGLTISNPHLHRVDVKTCRTTACKVTHPARGFSGLAGGAAFDGSQNVLWVSNGDKLDIIDAYSCKSLCPQQGVPQPASGAAVTTGIEYVEKGAGGTMYFLFPKVKPGQPERIGWASVNGCKIGSLKEATIGGTYYQWEASGLAIDEVNRRIFVGHTDTYNFYYFVTVLDLDNPSRVVCYIGLPGSGLNMISGLAYDACSGSLFISNGNKVVWGTLTYSGSKCTWAMRGSCSSLSTMSGIAIVPPRPNKVGSPCSSAPCNACPAITASLVGAPVLGNGGFAVALQGAPANVSAAFLAIGFGPCTNPGLGLGFCGPVRIHLSAPPILLAVPWSNIGGACGATARVAMPIPVTRSLCSSRISVQWLALCGTNGSALTTCLDFGVTGL